MKSKALPGTALDPLAFEAEALAWSGVRPMAPDISMMSPSELMRHALVKLESSSVHQTPEKAAAIQYLTSALSMVSVVTCSSVGSRNCVCRRQGNRAGNASVDDFRASIRRRGSDVADDRHDLDGGRCNAARGGDDTAAGSEHA